MAYAKRSLKKKTTKKRSSMKRKAPKARVTSRGRMQGEASHRKTGYVRALLDPKDGPLVGVPQFVPIDTHRVRARSIGTFTTSTGKARIFFNPCRMVSNDTGPAAPIRVWTNAGTGAVDDSTTSAETFVSNVTHASGDFQDTDANGVIDNGDGIKARVVAAMIRCCNVSAVQTRGGVFTALHEPHHKTLETFTLSDLSNNTKSIIRPAGDGGYVSLLYRPVKPEEVEEWQINSRMLPGQGSFATGGEDGTVNDSYPGYMAIDFQGAANSTLHVEAYAIVEYAGESMTTLSRPIHLGGGTAATPSDGAKGAKDAHNMEQQQGKSESMDIDAAFETQPNSPASVQAIPGDNVRMEIADLRRSVASNAREIRKNRSGIQRSKEKARIAGAVNAYMKKTPRKSVYSFKSTPRASSRRRY